MICWLRRTLSLPLSLGVLRVLTAASFSNICPDDPAVVDIWEPGGTWHTLRTRGPSRMRACTRPVHGAMDGQLKLN